MESTPTPGADLGPDATSLGDQPWEALALLAVLVAMASVLSRTRRRRLVRALERIAADWENGATALPAAPRAAAWFLRPALRYLRQEE